MPPSPHSASNLTVRYMQIRDIPEVLVIDRASFTPAWPERSYRFELNESPVSFMTVLERREEQPITGLRKFFRQLSGEYDPTEPMSVIVGYGGLWKVEEEAHISTIASHPDYRGNKYGEIVLASMVKRAMALKAGYVVLEVRVSNIVAQNLYKKYGFEIRGVKKGYYHHDKEDAYDMRIEFDDAALAKVETLYEALQQKVPFTDNYSDTLHPRLNK